MHAIKATRPLTQQRDGRARQLIEQPIRNTFSAALRPQRPYQLLGARRGDRDVHLDFHTAPGFRLPTQVQVQRCSTSTETIPTIRPYQLLGTRRGAQDVHLDFYTSPELWLPTQVQAQCPQRPYGLLGTRRGAQDVHLDFYTSPELWLPTQVQAQCCFTSTETIRTIRSTFTQLLRSGYLHKFKFNVHKDHTDY